MTGPTPGADCPPSRRRRSPRRGSTDAEQNAENARGGRCGDCIRAASSRNGGTDELAGKNTNPATPTIYTLDRSITDARGSTNPWCGLCDGRLRLVDLVDAAEKAPGADAEPVAGGMGRRARQARNSQPETSVAAIALSRKRNQGIQGLVRIVIRSTGSTVNHRRFHPPWGTWPIRAWPVPITTGAAANAEA